MEWIQAAWGGGYAYLALLLALMIVNLLPPIPAEVLIPFSATLFANHGFSLPLAIAMGTIGLVLGTLPLYQGLLPFRTSAALASSNCFRQGASRRPWLATAQTCNAA